MNPQKWSFRSEKFIFGHYWTSRSEFSPLCGFLLTYYSLCIHNDIQLLVLPVRVVIRELWTLKTCHLGLKSVVLAIIGPHGLNFHHCADFSWHTTLHVYIKIPNYYYYQWEWSLGTNGPSKVIIYGSKVYFWPLLVLTMWIVTTVRIFSAMLLIMYT